MGPICCNKELPEWENGMTWDFTLTWLLLWSPLAPIPHWVPEWVSNSFGCKSKQLSLISFSFHYGMETSLELGAWLKENRALSLCFSGRKKVRAKITLVSKAPLELAPVLEKKPEGPVLLMWIHGGHVLLGGKPSIITCSLGFHFSDNYIMSQMDIRLCNSPREKNGTPLVD